MSNTPSKKDIDDLVYTLRQKGDDSTYALVVEALAKWGTPQPVNLGFTIETRAGVDVLVWKEGGCRPATSAEIAMWKALSAVQQPVVRKPLTTLTIAPVRRFLADHGIYLSDETTKEMIVVAHGIAQKGGQHGTDT